jgi:hypothetical protein
MIAFRTKKTVTHLIRNFGIDGIIKEYLANQKGNETALNPKQQPIASAFSDNSKLDMQPPEPKKLSVTLQKTDISDPTMLSKTFGRIQPGKDVRLKAEEKIWQMGLDLGFKAYTEYEALNLCGDGYKRFISVIWKEGNEIKAAFQVRKKSTTLYFAQNPKDRRKLEALIADEKYLVNVSEITGEAVFFRVTDSTNKDFQISRRGIQ